MACVAEAGAGCDFSEREGGCLSKGFCLGDAHVEDVVAGTPSDGFPELSVKGACRLSGNSAEFAEGDLAVKVLGNEVDLLLYGTVLRRRTRGLRRTAEAEQKRREKRFADGAAHGLFGMFLAPDHFD